MGRLILHIGTHKTGTTSIQRTLNDQRESLHRVGVHYPDYAVIGRPTHYAHIGVANALAGDHVHITPAEAEAFFQSARVKAADHEVTLISAESMYRQTIGDIAPQAAPNEPTYWAIRDAYIRRLRAVTGPAEVVMVVRRQCDFAESMYQEHVKVTRYRGDFARYIREFWFHFRYFDQYLAWYRHFDKVRIVPFDSIKGDDIADRFLQSVGLRPGLVAPHPMQNVGIPHDGLLLKRELNQTPVDREALNRIAKAMTGERFRKLVRPGKRSFFSSAEARAEFQAQFDESNRELAIRTGHADQGLFGATSASEDPVYGDVLPPEERSRLIAALAAEFAGHGTLVPALRLLDETVPVPEITPARSAASRRRKRRRAAV